MGADGGATPCPVLRPAKKRPSVARTRSIFVSPPVRPSTTSCESPRRWIGQAKDASLKQSHAEGRYSSGNVTVYAADSKHLSELAAFVASEVRARGCADASVPSIARLEVFEEAMDRFLSKCSVFRPFLEAYRVEQARLRHAYAERMKELPRLREMVDATHAKTDAKVESERAKFIATETQMQKKIEELEATVENSSKTMLNLRSRTTKAEEVCKVATKEAEDSKQSTVLLTAALNRLEGEKEKWILQDNTFKSDIINLRTALDKSNQEKERLRGQNMELEELRAKERKHLTTEFETKLREMKEELDEVRGEYRSLHVKYRSLMSNDASSTCLVMQSEFAGAELVQKLDSIEETKEESGSLKRTKSSTTSLRRRSECGDDLAESEDESQRIIRPEEDVLTSKYVPKGEFFTALGTEESVPEYLRFQGRLKNWAISKGETEKMINDIWSAKAKVETQEDLSTYLYKYLVERFEDHVLAVEWAYNLLGGLRRYASDSDCSLFLNILDGVVPEEIRTDQLSMLVQVLQAMIKEDNAQNQERTTGSLTIPVFMQALRKLLSTKPDVNFLLLQRQLQIELENTVGREINYRDLLESDAEGNQSDFCELLRDQHVEEILEYGEHLAKTIRDAAAKHHDPKKMPLAMYRNAIVAADPEKPRFEVNTYLAQGANIDLKDLVDLEQSDHTCAPEYFLKHLSKILLKCSTPGGFAAHSEI